MIEKEEGFRIELTALAIENSEALLTLGCPAGSGPILYNQCRSLSDGNSLSVTFLAIELRIDPAPLMSGY